MSVLCTAKINAVGKGTDGMGAGKLGQKRRGRSESIVIANENRVGKIVSSGLGKSRDRALEGEILEKDSITEKHVSRKKMCSGQEDRQNTGQKGGKAATDPGAIGTLTGVSGDVRQEP